MIHFHNELLDIQEISHYAALSFFELELNRGSEREQMRLVRDIQFYNNAFPRHNSGTLRSVFAKSRRSPAPQSGVRNTQG